MDENCENCSICTDIYDAIQSNHKNCIIRYRWMILLIKLLCGETVLTWCINEDIDLELVKWLIESFNLDVNECDDRESFLISLVLLVPSPSHLEFAEWLLTKGLDINCRVICSKEKYSISPFYSFCNGIRCDTDEQSLNEFRLAARFFIFNGADLSIRNGNFDKTAYEIAEDPHKIIIDEIMDEYTSSNIKEPAL